MNAVVVMICFKALSQHLPESNEEIHKNFVRTATILEMNQTRYFWNIRQQYKLLHCNMWYIYMIRDVFKTHIC
jgi:hypothetical protein